MRRKWNCPLYYASLAENSKECCSQFEVGALGTNLLHLKQRSCVAIVCITSSWWNHYFPLWTNIRGQTLQGSLTLTLNMFFSQRSGVSEIKGKVKVKLEQVISQDPAVCVFEDVQWWKLTGVCKLTVASLWEHSDWEEAPLRTEDMLDTLSHLSLKNVKITGQTFWAWLCVCECVCVHFGNWAYCC